MTLILDIHLNTNILQQDTTLILMIVQKLHRRFTEQEPDTHNTLAESEKRHSNLITLERDEKLLEINGSLEDFLIFL